MRPLTATLSLSAILVATACSSSRPDVTVPLTFRPGIQDHGQYGNVKSYSSSLKLFVNPVSDDRPDKRTIGENIELENRPPRPVFASGPAPTEFVGSILSRELLFAGLSPVPEASQASRVLAVRLVRFYTTESSRYITDVIGAAEVHDASGHVLWSGQSVGRSNRFGRSLSPDNYNECFSSATVEMVAGILNDPGFRKAVMAE